ncbi:MAG: sugar phosphate nucleotidyltransferase [Bacillota bacterium]|nr:sugar phosphate nucleotidyltransferase [Bacillota bacterium]
MAGGSGERFWPYSRKEKPKQFLAIGGKESLLFIIWSPVLMKINSK